MKPEKIILIAALLFSAFMFAWVPVWGTATAFIVALSLVSANLFLDTWRRQAKLEGESEIQSQLNQIQDLISSYQNTCEEVKKNSRSIEALADHLELKKVI